MDPADVLELSGFISFNESHTTWQISRRLSAYRGNGKSDSFIDSVAFEVAIAGTDLKLLPNTVPKKAVLKVRSYAGSPKDMMHPDTQKELRALEQLTINSCKHTPRLLDARVILMEQKDNGKEVYLTCILMTMIRGFALKDGVFWDLSQKERDVIRRAFRIALSSIYGCWVASYTLNPQNLIWDREGLKLSMLNFQNSDTFNSHHPESLKHTLPPRFRCWRNEWYISWELSTRLLLPFDTADDGSDVGEYTYEYPATNVRPKFPGANIVKTVAKRVECAGERGGDGGTGMPFVRQRREGLSFLGSLRKVFGI